MTGRNVRTVRYKGGSLEEMSKGLWEKYASNNIEIPRFAVTGADYRLKI